MSSGSSIAAAYTLLRPAERDCCALTWEAVDRCDGISVVLDERHAAADPTAPTRWLQTAAGLESASLVRVRTVHPLEHATVVAREALPGQALSSLLERSGPPPATSLNAIAATVAGAIATLHAHGLEHGAPDARRVRWVPGTRIALALPSPHRWEDASSELDAHPSPGDLARLTPERIAGAGASDVAAATDVFVWGALILELAGGRPPFLAEDDVATARAVGTATPSVGLNVIGEPSLRELVGAALTADPTQRPPGGQALAAALATPDTSHRLTAARRAPGSPAPATRAHRAGARDTPTASTHEHAGQLTGAPAGPIPATRASDALASPDPLTRRWRVAAALASLVVLTGAVALTVLLTAGVTPRAEFTTLPTPDPDSAPSQAQDPAGTSTADTAQAGALVEVVAAPCAPLLADPEGDQLACVPSGAVVPIRETEDEWGLAIDDDGPIGWFALDDIAALTPP